MIFSSRSLTYLSSFLLPMSLPSLVQGSALGMTVLLGFGLFSFIRSSTKARIQTRTYLRDHLQLPELAERIRRHFEERAYRLEGMNERGVATFVGQEQPSAFLTVFLVMITGLGVSALVLVLGAVHPEWGAFPWITLLSAPVAGWYYNRQSRRQDTIEVLLQTEEDPSQIQLTVRGQRHQLDSLEGFLHFNPE